MFVLSDSASYTGPNIQGDSYSSICSRSYLNAVLLASLPGILSKLFFLKKKKFLSFLISLIKLFSYASDNPIFPVTDIIHIHVM